MIKRFLQAACQLDRACNDITADERYCFQHNDYQQMSKMNLLQLN